MKTHFRKDKFVSQVKWTVEMDAILIEKNTLTNMELMSILQINEAEVVERKKVLGLTKRTRQLRKMS